MKNYIIRFGSGDPRNSAGLSPTMLIFVRADTGATVAPPAISEIAATWGLYTFQWGTTTPIAFLCDGATTGLVSGRYVTGSLDPADRADEYGTTMVAIANTLIFNAPAGMGSTLQALGQTAVTGIVNQGTTLVAIGNTAITGHVNIGTTLVAIGNTAITGINNIGTSLTATAAILANQGTSLTATALVLTNTGTTLVAIGNTAITGVNNIGTSLTATALVLANQGTTLVAIGNTAITGHINIGTTLVAVGNTAIAIGTTTQAIATTILATGVSVTAVVAGVGSTASSFGTSSVDPVDLFGYLKRLQELLEGNNIFTKLTGDFQMLSRGSTTLLRDKTVTNSVTTITKT